MDHEPDIAPLAVTASLRRLSFPALAALDVEGVHNALARELLAAFEADEVHVAHVSPDRSTGRVVQYRAGHDGAVVPHATYTLSLDGPSGVVKVALTGVPLVAENATISEDVNQALVDRFGVASAVFLPASFDEGPLAVATLVYHERHPVDAHELALMLALTDQCAATLAVMDMRASLNDQAEREAALARAASALNARLDLQSVLETLCREVDLALGGDTTGFYLGDGINGGLGVAGHGIAADSSWYGYVMRPGEGVAGRVLQTGEAVVTNAYQSEVEVPDTAELRAVQTAVGVPVRWDGELKGALSVGFRTMRLVADEDMEILQAMADLAAVACSNAEAFQRAQVAARTDSLTGLLNHGAVHVRLREEIARVARSGEPLSCLLADLDGFKPVNDLHGHLVGDQILRQVADAVSEEFRLYDGIGRFGGDEFVLVLPGLDSEGAIVAAHRLRSTVERAVAQDALGDVTASVGVARWREPLSAGELLDRADRALLVAKRRGGDQVALATRQTEAELARLDALGNEPSALLADLWDVVSQCDHPRQVLARLPELLTDSLGLAECVVVHPDLLARHDELLRRLDGGSIARSSLGTLREALALEGELPLRGLPGAYAALLLQHDGELHGLLLMRSDETPFPLTSLRLAELVGSQAVTALIGQVGGASRTAVGALAAAIDARDNYTHRHSEQVVALATGVARRLELGEREVELIRDGAMLHDVGKVAIPNEILYKPGPLDPAEWAVMREHPVIGERIILRTPELVAIAPIVRHEHERWDGRGYPDGLAGTEIPIGSRVILACDAYNAMITARPYREPMTEAEARAELQQGAGTQFDPDVVAALMVVLAEQPAPVSELPV
jgi:diguanylate cyclase (GGDEF)-like protein